MTILNSGNNQKVVLGGIENEEHRYGQTGCVWNKQCFVFEERKSYTAAYGTV